MEPFRSVETIWLLWALSVASLAALSWQALGRLRGKSLAWVLRGEDGAAYTMSLMMVVPIYLFLLCLVVETTLVLVAKSGSIYAAYQAARAGTVWYSAARPAEAEAKMRQAAIEAFVPFASGTQPDRGNVQESKQARKYLDAYAEYVAQPAARRYMASKYRYAEKALRVKTLAPPAAWHSDIEAEVNYEYPFSIPGIARLLGEKGADGNYYFPLTSKATLQNEGPKNETQTVGIRYASPK